MPIYSVGITAKISKTYNIEAPDADKAAEVAHQIFTVEIDGHEHYDQEMTFTDEIGDGGVLDARYEEEETERCTNCNDVFGAGEFARSRQDDAICHWCATNADDDEG